MSLRVLDAIHTQCLANKQVRGLAATATCRPPC